MPAEIKDMLTCPRCKKPLKRMLNWSAYKFSTTASGVYGFDCDCFNRNIRITVN